MEPSILTLVAPTPTTLMTNAGASSGASSLAFADTTSVVDGQTVSGTGIVDGTLVTGHSATSVALSQPIDAAILSGGAVNFGPYPTLLSSLDNVKQELAIDADDGAYDAQLSRYLRMASNAAIAYCRRPLLLRTYDEVWRGTPFVDSASLVNNPIELVLRRRPVGTLYSLVIDEDIDGSGPLTQGTDFELDPSVGFLWRMWNDIRMRWFFRKLEAVYSAGWVYGASDPTLRLPDEIEQAAINLVKFAWFGRTRDPLLRSRGDPGLGAAEQYWVGDVGAPGALPPSVQFLLDPYRETNWW